MTLLRHMRTETTCIRTAYYQIKELRATYLNMTLP